MGIHVKSNRPFSLVYSLCKHEFLGYLIEPHVVQLNVDGSFSLTYQRVFVNTVSDFISDVDNVDLQLIGLLEEIEQSQIIKQYNKKSIRPSIYFSNVFNQDLYEVIRLRIEDTLTTALTLLKDRPLFLMSKEGWPVGQAISIAENPCSVLFHFRCNEEEVRYFPTIKHEGKRIEFMYRDAQIIINQPAVMLLGNTLYHFNQDVDGKKLTPFLNKRYISVPHSAQHNYFERFVAPLIERYNVYAEGFDIKTKSFEAVPILRLANRENARNLLLQFKYGPYVFEETSDVPITVKMEYDPENDYYTFVRVRRSLQWEDNRIKDLWSLGLESTDIPTHLSVSQIDENTDGFEYHMVDWLNDHVEILKGKGYQFIQEGNDKQYVFGQMEVDFEVKEQNDWFDILAEVEFDDIKIPFINLKYHILNHIREFTLPSGKIALIPEQWFSRFANIFQFSSKGKLLKLKKHHIGIIQQLQNNRETMLNYKEKISQLSNFEKIEAVEVPKNFKGSLRPYQKAGYDWFHFLKKYGFGGCLADDMGLGKTVQTLALLQKEKDNRKYNEANVSLIVMPTSLIYNWLNEAEKFAPKLKILNHTGSQRAKSPDAFTKYDVVLSTYGIVRIDIDILREFYFNYLILDESQNIKNVNSKAFRAIRTLNGQHKLILTGTPIENSVADLWPQMEFINSGLLGGYNSFMKNFVIPIEKKKDENKGQQLQALIKPFVLRRTKEQVANELPDKSEQIFYCAMTEHQEIYYEKVKSEFRNSILQQTNDDSLSRSGIQVLRGLNKLRQLANHPLMIDEEYSNGSGKFDNVIHHLKNVLLRGHKVLIFSSFVKQMKIYREYFDENGLKYAYLDGATKNRGEVVKGFREDESLRIFLISIKAGGTGLNLTEADYVFILDPWWNPAVEKQAIDRAHRIGQTKNVFIYKFITKDTVEERILSLQRRKKGISDALIRIEEDFVKSLTVEDIQELLL